MTANFAIADFDGDQQADLATVQGSGVTSSQSQYWIRFQLTTGDGQSFGLTAPSGGLELSARDVNGDNVPDVIVSTSWLNRPVAILLNNGHGRFALVDPAEFPEVMRNTEDPQGLQPPSSNETVAVGLSRGSNDVCDMANLLRRPFELPETAGQAAPRSPVFPSLLSWHGRAPPACVHHV